ncbi:MAG TPA: hypothetical protein VD932_03820 [Aquabacterium sp.]|nr:hypothetical protein [Aquabacterium sp.]
MNTLAEILPSIDALNSFVRSKSYRSMYASMLKRVIYHYKREALIAATNEGIVEHRHIVCPLVKCHGCGGDGRWKSWYEDRTERCRRCAATGFVNLDFIESRLGGFVWHSPVRDAWDFARGWRQWPTNLGDWAPHQQGRDLTTDQVAEHLLTVEASSLPRPKPFHGDYDWDYSTYYPHEDYGIDIGEARPDACTVCGSVDGLGRLGLSTGRLHWNAVVCRPCSNGGSDRVRAALPAYLITPTIQRWIDTHPVRERNA